MEEKRGAEVRMESVSGFMVVDWGGDEGVGLGLIMLSLGLTCVWGSLAVSVDWK
jgi:hypothetical protein